MGKKETTLKLTQGMFMIREIARLQEIEKRKEKKGCWQRGGGAASGRRRRGSAGARRHQAIGPLKKRTRVREIET